MRRAAGAWILARVAVVAHAQTLRWGSRGDVGSLDPHSFNEGLSDALVGHVHERLARHGRELH